jgi:subtilisin family serine protease
MRSLLVLILLSFLGSPARAADDFTPDPRLKIDAWLEGQLLHAGSDGFLVRFEDSEGMARTLEGKQGARQVYDTLRARSRAKQAGVRALLDAAGIPWKPLWIVNGLEVRAGDLTLARALAERPEVVTIVGNPRVRGFVEPEAAEETQALLAPEWGVLRVNADDVWLSDAVRGAGIVVASADTGVEWSHPAIQSQYRGWNPITLPSHDYNWHDAIADLAAPIDDHNHGTHTVGTMVGDDGGTNQIGVAPSARWIGCRNMNLGVGSPSTYLDCMQFFIAPYPQGGDPELDGDPTKAPHIVNNSWGCPPSEGCDVNSLLDGLAATRAAGILFVAAAGNSGSSCATVSDPPAIHADAFTVGAIDINNNLASFSSRGPVTIDGSSRLKPDVAAPGVGVRSCIRNGLYSSFNGTSMASPHTSGVAALLWSARPLLRGRVGITRCLLSQSSNGTIIDTTATCGGTTRLDRPNHLFGWGLVDAYNAIHLPDGDADGIADACDCASTDGGAYDAPGEVDGLGYSGPVGLAWGSLAPGAGDGTVYDLIRGDLAELRSGAPIDLAACLATGLAATEFDDPSSPAAEAGYFYLVQGRNGCGVGGYGTDAAGNPREHAVCP